MAYDTAIPAYASNVVVLYAGNDVAMTLQQIHQILEKESLNWPWLFLWRYNNPTQPGDRYHNGLDWFDYLKATDEQLFYCRLIVGMYER